MKVAVFEAAEREHDAYLRLEPRRQACCPSGRPTPTLARTFADAGVATIFIKSELTAAAIAQLPALKLIATRSTGHAHADLTPCTRRNNAICIMPDYGDFTAVAYAFALLLAVSRRTVEAAARTRAGDFGRAGASRLRPRRPDHRGCGDWPHRAAGIQIARGFGLKAVATDVVTDREAAQHFGFECVSRPDPLRRSDVVSLPVPCGAQTRDLIADAEFAQMKRGSALINTARHGVVSAAALRRTLSSEGLAGPTRGVLSLESLRPEQLELFPTDMPPPAEPLRLLLAANALLQLPNVLVTPRIADDTGEAMGRILGTTLNNIEAFARGEPRNPVAGPDSAELKGRPVHDPPSRGLRPGHRNA